MVFLKNILEKYCKDLKELNFGNQRQWKN